MAPKNNKTTAAITNSTTSITRKTSTTAARFGDNANDVEITPVAKKMRGTDRNARKPRSFVHACFVSVSTDEHQCVIDNCGTIMKVLYIYLFFNAQYFTFCFCRRPPERQQLETRMWKSNTQSSTARWQRCKTLAKVISNSERWCKKLKLYLRYRYFWSVLFLHLLKKNLNFFSHLTARNDSAGEGVVARSVRFAQRHGIQCDW